ncbi:MAG: hypothetical protein GXO78_09450 [Calditrichaeota bacterium]|nr:hypothetical protein [Calditrichota bacterium]
MQCIPVSVNKLWGTDKNNIFAVGALGKIAHYNGVSWRRVKSGVRKTIHDIIGIPNKDNYLILAPAGVRSSVIFQINSDMNVTQFPWDSEKEVLSVWGKRANVIYACGESVWVYVGGKWREIKGLPKELWGEIRGTDENNIFLGGALGGILHFNGKSWKYFHFVPGSICTAVAVKGNLVVFTYSTSRNAYLVIGKNGGGLK